MIEINILGSASGVPTKNRFCESIVISIFVAPCTDLKSGIPNGQHYFDTTLKEVYLFDAGEPCSSLLVRGDIPYNKIKAVFISHMDPDHSSGIFMLIQLMELTGRELPFNIYVPDEALDGLCKYLRTVYLFKELLRFELKILPLSDTFAYRDECLNLHTNPNNHLKKRLKEKYPELELESYSFGIELDEKRIVYSGDIWKPEDLQNLLKEKTDLLICEMAHFKPEELFKYLSGKSIEKIIVTHIHPDLNNKQEQLEEMGNKYLGENKISIAYDGLKMEI